MKKRISAILLALCLALALFPTAVFAASSDFQVENGTLTKYLGQGGDVVIPADLGILMIGKGAFKGNNTVTSVYIPNTVKVVGDSAFHNCSALKSVDISNSVAEIADSAFENCISLTRVTLPESLNLVGDNAFNGCSSLTEMTVLNLSVTFGKRVFSGVPLRDIYYVGTQGQWEENIDTYGGLGGSGINFGTVDFHYNTPIPAEPTPPQSGTDPTPTDPTTPTTPTTPTEPTTPTTPTEPTEIKVTGVKVSKTALTMEVGQSETLTAAVTPANAANTAVTWTSNNNAAVSVDANGKVTALAAGAAEITAKTADGGFTAVCRVIVKGEDKPAPVEVHFPRANVYNQGQFTDVPADQWYTDSVKQAFELGLMKGTSDTVFDPNGEITVAQAITMAARIHSIYTTGTENFQASGRWYQVYLDYAFQNGIISYAYYNSDVTKNATRAQFAEIFANALPDEALSPINTVSKIPDVPSSAYYADHAYKLYRAGILAGGDANGTFSPDSYINRKEAAAIVSRMAESSIRVRFTL